MGSFFSIENHKLAVLSIQINHASQYGNRQMRKANWFFKKTFYIIICQPAQVVSVVCVDMRMLLIQFNSVCAVHAHSISLPFLFRSVFTIQHCCRHFWRKHSSHQNFQLKYPVNQVQVTHTPHNSIPNATQI